MEGPVWLRHKVSVKRISVRHNLAINAGRSDWSKDLAFAPDRSWLAAVCDNGTILLYRVERDDNDDRLVGLEDSNKRALSGHAKKRCGVWIFKRMADIINIASNLLARWCV